MAARAPPLPAAPLLAMALASALLAAAPPGGASGPSPEVDAGGIPVWFAWTTPVLDVVVLPPHHGPVGLCSTACAPGQGPGQALELEHYWSAVEAFMADWIAARDAWVEANPKDAWLGQVALRTTWAYRETITPQHLAEAEVVVGNWETGGAALGVAIHPMHANALQPVRDAVGDKCVALGGLSFAANSFTWNDYYNIGGHEFGHCLGLGHAEVEHDLMDGTYDHLPGLGSTLLHCPSNLDAAGLTLSFGPAFGRPSEASITVQPWKRYHPRAGCE
jgi:hypothetical protein